MRKLSIYESLRTWFADDPALEDLAKSLDVLRNQNIEVERFDIEAAPEAFERNEYVSRYLKTFGEERLPLVLVDGFPVIAGLRLRFFRPPVPTALQDLRAGRHILLRRHQSKISVRVLGAQKHALGLDSREFCGL